MRRRERRYPSIDVIALIYNYSPVFLYLLPLPLSAFGALLIPHVIVFPPSVLIGRSEWRFGWMDEWMNG